MINATTVVNLRQQAYDVYIGRNRRNQGESKWGNPFIVAKPAPSSAFRKVRNSAAARGINPRLPLNREEAIALHREWLHVQLAKGKLTPDDFRELQGKRLGCFCKPSPCHGDTLAELAEWFTRNPHAIHGPDAGDP